MSFIVLVTQNWHGSNIPLTYNHSHRSGNFTQMQKCILVACPPKITACIRGNPTKASSVNRDLTPKILPPCKTLHYICEHMTSTTTLHKTILNHNYVEFATCKQNFSPMNSQYICVSCVRSFPRSCGGHIIDHLPSVTGALLCLFPTQKLYKP